MREVKNRKELIMKITPVNYNYTNQKGQKSNNQQNFGMILNPQGLNRILRQVYSKGEAYNAFKKVVTSAAAELGELNHDGRPIIGTIRRHWRGKFTVMAKCETTYGYSDEFKAALGNTAKDGEDAGYRLILAARQAAQNSRPMSFLKTACDAHELDRNIFSSDKVAPKRGF